MANQDPCINQVACVTAAASSEPGCPNTPVTPAPITTGFPIAKIPVVLAELMVQINLDSTITLPEPALEIKRIKKRVKITQCLLLQNTNKLFLRGFVRKNIEFATRNVCSSAQGFCGEIRHCTADIPFRCVTAVTFNGIAPAPVLFNTINEFEFFKTQTLGPEFAEKDQLESGDFSEFNQENHEFFNERPFCELISATITEFDEFLNRRHPAGLPFEEIEFSTIEEKMVIDLVIKVLQNRQVQFAAMAPTP